MNGKSVASGRIEQTQGFMFSADEGVDVGVDLGTYVTDYGTDDNKFSGQIDHITINVKPIETADKLEHDKLHAVGSLKKALSD